MRFRSKAGNSNSRNAYACVAGAGAAGVGKARVGKRKAGNRNSANRNLNNRGFTLVELAVVISMILILLSIALPMYMTSLTHAREAKLKQNLATLNEVIEKYSLDKGHAPQSLNDLVDAGYIKFIPDDITGSSDTWKTEQEEDPEKAWDPNQVGIKSVHSGSDEASSEGSAYSTW